MTRKRSENAFRRQPQHDEQQRAEDQQAVFRERRDRLWEQDDDHGADHRAERVAGAGDRADQAGPGEPLEVAVGGGGGDAEFNGCRLDEKDLLPGIQQGSMKALASWAQESDIMLTF